MDAIRNFETAPHNVHFVEERGGFGYSRILNEN